MRPRQSAVKGNSLALTISSRCTILSTASHFSESPQASPALWNHFSTSTKSAIRWQRAGRNPGQSAKSLSSRRCPRSPRHWGTFGHRKFSRPSTASRRQTLQKYFCVWFLFHLLEIDNHLYALSAVGAYEEVVEIEDPRHGGMEGSRHGGQIIGLSLNVSQFTSLEIQRVRLFILDTCHKGSSGCAFFQRSKGAIFGTKLFRG